MKKLGYLIAPILCFSTLVGCNLDDSSQTYKVAFYNEYQPYGEIQEVKKNNFVIKPSEDPTKEKIGHEEFTFEHWSLDKKSEYDFKTPVTSDLNLYAVYSSAKYYTVHFDVKDGTGDFPDQKVKEGDTVSEPTNKPTKEHDDDHKYPFKEWQLKDQKYDFNSRIEEDITLKACYDTVDLDIFTVSFNLNGGEGSFEDIPVKEFHPVDKPEAVPTKEHDDKSKYKFNEWREEGKDVGFDFQNTEITHDITLVANYTPIPFSTYTVTFVLNDGVANPALPPKSVKEFGKITKPESEITKDSTCDTDFKFSYWSTSNEVDAEEYDFDTQILSDVTLYAHYEETPHMYNVKFMCGLQAETELYSTTSEYNGTIEDFGETPPVIDYEGYTYTFKSWVDKDGNEFKFNGTPIVEDTILHADYTSEVSKYLVTLTIDGDEGSGTVSGGGTFDYNSEITITATPNSGSGYHFVAWLDENGSIISTESTCSLIITKVRNISAKFRKTLTIKVETNARSSVTEGYLSLYGAGTYYVGDTVSLSFSWHCEFIYQLNFRYWADKNGTKLSNLLTYSFTANSNATYQAVFD